MNENDKEPLINKLTLKILVIIIIIYYIYNIMEFNEKFDFFIGDKNKKRLVENYLKEKYCNLYEEVISYNSIPTLINLPFQQKIYHFLYDLKVLPTCIECSNLVNFKRPFSKGYSKFCSHKCQNNNKEVKDKLKDTCIKKYGVSNPSKSGEVISKRNNTMMERYGVSNPLQVNEFKEKQSNTIKEKYGVEHYSQTKEFSEKIKTISLEKHGVEHFAKSKEVKDKTEKTNIERYGSKSSFSNKEVQNKYKEIINKKYGVDNPFQSEEIKEKIKSEYIKKYGVEYTQQIDEIKEKTKTTNLNKLISKYSNTEDFISFNESTDEFSIKCNDCNIEYIIERALFRTRGYRNDKICLNCNPLHKQYSNPEKEISEFIKSMGVNNVIENDRKILGGKELDIFIPSHNLAIEHDGLYWHNEIYVNNDYHSNKSKICESKGIKLIHIFGDEWLYKKDIVKSRLRNMLGLNEIKIYGRKCIIKEVSSKESKEFLIENHIQGNVNSKIKIGLYYNDELVSLMTFGGLRKSMGGKSEDGFYELLRFCNKLDTSVIGGANKLLKDFIKVYTPKEIVSYADRRWSQGDLYNKLGFKFISNSKNNYWYVIGSKREYRFKYRKDVLLKEGFDKNKTEKEIMFDRKIFRIYDCGNKKFIFKRL